MCQGRKRIGVGEIAGLIERVDRHVQQEHVIHRIPKSAKMRANEKIAMDGGDPTEGSAG